MNIIRNIFSSCSKRTTSQQCRGSCWSLRDWCPCCWGRVLFVFLFVEQNGVTAEAPISKSSNAVGKKGVSMPGLKNSVYDQLIIFPVELNIVQISRHLIGFCVRTSLCTYAWKYLVPLFMCSLLVGGNWNSRKMIVKELLSLRQQQAPSWQRNFSGTFCLFLDEIFYNESHWIWSKSERQLNTVVGDLENHAALMWTKGAKNEDVNEVLVNCINQWSLDTIIP